MHKETGTVSELWQGLSEKTSTVPKPSSVVTEYLSSPTPPTNSHLEALNLNVIVFGGGVFGRLLSLDGVMRLEVSWWIPLIVIRHRRYSKRVAICRPGRGPSPRICAGTWSWTLSLQELWEINVWCFKPPSLWYFCSISTS